MRVVYGLDAPVAAWVLDRIPHADGFGEYFRAVAVADRNDDIAAGIVWHDYQPGRRAIEVSMAARTPRWATHSVISEVLRYPFVQLDLVRVTACVPRTATNVGRFLEGLGFLREGLIRKGFGADDAVVYGLLQEEWRAGRFGPERGGLNLEQEVRPETAARA